MEFILMDTSIGAVRKTPPVLSSRCPTTRYNPTGRVAVAVPLASMVITVSG